MHWSSGFGTITCTSLPSCCTVVDLPPQATSCSWSAVANAWMRLMSACFCAVARSNTCCCWSCCAATFFATAARNCGVERHLLELEVGEQQALRHELVLHAVADVGLDVVAARSWPRRRSGSARTRGARNRAPTGLHDRGRVVGAEVAVHRRGLVRIDPVQHRGVHRGRTAVLTEHGDRAVDRALRAVVLVGAHRVVLRARAQRVGRRERQA